jgi:hypothetical protein
MLLFGENWIERDFKANKADRVRTLTGKEIELDIEADYKVYIYPLVLHVLHRDDIFMRASRHPVKG